MKSLFLALIACCVLAGPLCAAEVAPNDLKQIGLAFHNHCDATNKGPAKAEDLAPYFENDKKLLALLKDGDVVFIYGVSVRDMAKTTGTSNTVLAYEKNAGSQGGLVLMGDGSVKKLTAEEFKNAKLAKVPK